MSRGRRYETEGKLNYQKVFAVIIAIIVIAMVVMIIKNVFIQREKLNKEYEYFTAFSADKWGFLVVIVLSVLVSIVAAVILSKKKFF